MSERYKVVILPEAQKDIRDIVFYIASELAAPQAALGLQDAFEEEIRSLSYMPDRVRLVEEQPWKDAGVRKTRVKNYYIYYVISEAGKEVRILAVIYVGREQRRQMTDRRLDQQK